MKHFEITDICHGCVKVGRNGGHKSWIRGGKVNSKYVALLWGIRQNRQVGKQNTQ